MEVENIAKREMVKKKGRIRAKEEKNRKKGINAIAFLRLPSLLCEASTIAYMQLLMCLTFMW